MDGVEFIVRLRAKGEKSDAALKSAYKEEFGSTKNYTKDTKDAKTVISEYFQRNIEELANDVALHLWDLYGKNYKLQDYRECRTILKQITDLTGIVNEAAPAVQKKTSSLHSLRPAKVVNE